MLAPTPIAPTLPPPPHFAPMPQGEGVSRVRSVKKASNLALALSLSVSVSRFFPNFAACVGCLALLCCAPVSCRGALGAGW